MTLEIFNPTMATQNSTKTKDFFQKINNMTCLFGLVNLWGEDTPTPTLYRKRYYKFIFNLMNLCIIVLMILEISAFAKWRELTFKEITDLIVFALTHPILFWYSYSVFYYESRAKALLRCMCVALKEVYNDEKLEQRMISRAKFYITVSLTFCGLTLILYGFNSLIRVIGSGKTFTSLVTIWPDAEDRSKVAGAARVAIYVVWWFLLVRGCTACTLAIANTVCVMFQFKTVQAYFYGLKNIFMYEDLNQIQKEEKYEEALKVGIKLHSDTLWCARQCQIVYNWVYSGQILLCLMSMAVLMVQLLKSDQSLAVVLAIAATACAVLGTNGICMWNAGDVSIQAAAVAGAIYSSGWQRCERAGSVRVRRLLAVAMAQAQKPVIIRGCFVVEMSHKSFLSIIKTSYSVFSMIY